MPVVPGRDGKNPPTVVPNPIRREQGQGNAGSHSLESLPWFNGPEGPQQALPLPAFQPPVNGHQKDCRQQPPFAAFSKAVAQLLPEISKPLLPANLLIEDI